jgi:hypothetical protein
MLDMSVILCHFCIICKVIDNFRGGSAQPNMHVSRAAQLLVGLLVISDSPISYSINIPLLSWGMGI